MVFYRKYRPQKISELDLVTVREKLTSILKSKDLPHAFLFSGPKGLGKTSSARILAKAINCKSKKGIEPCNQCDICKSITSGSHIDVLEIDAASNRGIDEIRDLRDKIKYLPSELSKKVYIIDEVHMLTNEAFNALLKTLEEPPPHAVFILCTTEAWRIPPTILSRAFYIQFEKPSIDELARSLGRIIKDENLKIDEDALEKVYSLSEGAFRDAAKIIEELSLLAEGKEITLSLLDHVYKTESIERRIENLFKFLDSKDVKNSLETINLLSGDGVDFKIVNEKIVEKLHSLILSHATDKKTGFSFTLFDLEKLISYFSESYQGLRFAVIPSLPIELAVIRYCIGESGEAKIENQELEKKEENISQETEKAERSESKEEIKVEELKEKAEVNKRDSEMEDQEKKDTSEDKLVIFTTKEETFLPELILRIKKDNFSIAGVLRGCRLISLKDGKVHLMTSFKFHKDKLEENKAREIVEQKSQELLGRKVELIVDLKVN